MKKYILILGLVALLMASTLLAGCSSDAKSAATTGQTTSASTTAEITIPVTTSAQTSATTTKTSATIQPTSVTTTSSGTDIDAILGQSTKYSCVYYEVTMSVPGSPSISMKNYIKNNAKYRIESTAGGFETVTLMDAVSGTLYVIYTAMNMAVQMPYDATQAPEDPESLTEYTPTTLGTDTIDGHACTIIGYDAAGIATRCWIWNDTGFPLKAEMTMDGQTTTMDYTNYSFENIDDSMFELPYGVQITDMNDLQS